MFRKIAIVTLVLCAIALLGYFVSRNSANHLLLWQSTLIPGGITGPNSNATGNPIHLLDNETILTFGMLAPPTARSMDGSVRWAFIPPAKDEYCVNIAIEMDSMVLLGTNKNFLHALDTSGNLLWTTKIPGTKERFCSFVFGEDSRIYAFARGFAYCLGLDGNIIWKTEVTELSPTGIPVIGPKGNIYGRTSQLELVAISPDGAEMWRSPPGTAGIDRFFVTKSGTVICPRLIRDVVNAIDSQGNLLWTYTCNAASSFNGKPAFSPDGTTYVFEVNPQTGDRLIAIDASGKFLWGYPCDVGFAQVSVLTDGRIAMVGTDYGRLAMTNQFTMLVWSFLGNTNGKVTLLDQQGNVELTAKLPTDFSTVPPVEIENDKLLVLGVDGVLYCYSTKY